MLLKFTVAVLFHFSCHLHLVAGEVGEFATFAKFTIKLFVKFTILVEFAIFAACKGDPLVLLFALSRWFLVKWSKSPARQCKALLAVNLDHFANFVVACTHFWT